MSNAALKTDILDKAILFAVNAHKGTERRGKGTPYITHPMEACAIVSGMTSDQEIMAAAILHDVLEDTDVTEEEMRAEFGDRITDLVISESDEPAEDENASWQERKIAGIERLENATRDEQIVAMGDKLSNMRALAKDFNKKGDDLWKIFHAPDPRYIGWRYRKLAKAFNKITETAEYKEFNDLVEDTFSRAFRNL